ncbi:nodulation-signaling pathway 2 protein [Amborella trichopoda]|uniref:Uncharacterized protein n=1 Tax=Amborella trichopoda TaxID=13333 RepID=W1PKW7_AMBTC|nr:nodulation-signaling pathway 2 protein [Amborella trichopoda]ERN08311.1 hypothetical protein AMTR_s00156p00061400 [Amborella trichopoda]|eukprot:XP_020524303.1 nodulation-signaling pathway 2 protein [Amborella trichopoda]
MEAVFDFENEHQWFDFRPEKLLVKCNSTASSGCSTATLEEEMCEWQHELSGLDGRSVYQDGAPLIADEDEWMVGGEEEWEMNGLLESMMDEPSWSDGGSQFGVVSDDEWGARPVDEGDDSKGLRLVHLLVAAAEAVTGAAKSRDLAWVILVRLKELVSPTQGCNIERLAAYFTEGLQCLLEGHGPKPGSWPDPQADLMGAFQLLQDMSPCIKFAHFTANQAILEAVTSERRVHVLDFDIIEGAQWASLMQALSSRTQGQAPVPHLRITAVTRGGQSGRRALATVQETGRRLVAFAASIGQPFSFHQCRLDPDEKFRPDAVKLVKGEALVANCVLHLPHSTYRTPGSVASFLNGAKELGPKVVTLVEEEMMSSTEGFEARFMELLHHYSAVYDSLEASFPQQGRARAMVERVFLGPRIAASLAYHHQQHGRGGSWAEWMGSVGFKPLPVTFFNHCQAKLLVGLFSDGFRVEEARSRLVLGWGSRQLVSASVWGHNCHSCKKKGL